MIKRSESKSNYSPRKRSTRVNKRRLMMEGLEKRELLAVILEPPTQPPPTNLPEFPINRNIGAVQAFSAFESERINEDGQNDIISNADFLRLGTGPGQQDTIDVIGSLPVRTFIDNMSGFTSDIDTFSFDLRAGDILDIATLGAAGGITVRDASGTMIIASDVLIGGIDAPLQSTGNANATVVIHEDGRYFVTTSAVNASSNYTLGLRVYRPTTEQLAIGDTQILYLDFAGDLIDNNIFNDALITANPGLPVGGVTRVRSLANSLPILGLELGDVASANKIIDDVIFHMERIYEDLVRTGGNGDIESPTAEPGDYGIRILNSRDHAGQVSFSDPRVTRLLIGGTGVDFGVAGAFGTAQSVDIGNFDLNEFGIFALDAFAATAAAAGISPSASQVDFIGFFLASVAAHEAAHTFGMIHTDNTNTIGTLSDAGGSLNSINYFEGIGNDGIFGTSDDILPIFKDDFYMPGEVPDLNGFAINFVTKAMAHVLSSGKVGSTITGRVFEDTNRDGNGIGDDGITGVTVFADIDGDGVFDPGEPSDITGATGLFSLGVPSTGVNVIAVTPNGFVPTTPTTVGSSGRADFGFAQVVSDITGSVFSDSDGNRLRDPGEGGIGGIYLYADLDGDNRPDLGEPAINSLADGTYSIDFPGPGTYTVRPVVPPGFELTSPVSGEHTVVFNGVALTNNFDFGFLPSSDFGDAPDSYGTTIAADGASHGITAGLTIGATVDREIDGQPNISATGDDINGGDDEDGVRLLSPLGPGDAATFAVTVSNTTGSPAFLQAFMDFNRDGDFADVGEKFASDIPVPLGAVGSIIPVTVSVPPGASVGSTYARFRLSQTSGLGPTGFATTGEVEDYSFPILDAAQIANNDEFTVSRNTLSNELDVLGNDFQTFDNQLFIENLNTTGTAGQVVRALDGKSVFYTPQNGFIGRDVFSYTVVDQFNNRSTALVVVNVSFQSNIPIALDDTFEVPEGSVNRALNVLDNDVPSTFGGISITSVTPGTAGGTITIIGGGQSLRYTPLPGFNGTEQFSYSIQDDVGSTSSATVTVNLLPGSFFDDVVDFSIEIFDPVNTNTPITNVQVGDEILVRVSVDDLRLFASPQGVASAFLDLLYTDELVATLNTDNNPNFPFDITFGPLFSGSGVLQSGNSQIPGLIDEIGGVQQIGNQQSHTGPVELFTLKMRAVSPGVAVFQADPADLVTSETAVLASDTALTPSQLRLGTAELLIAPASANFTSAIDDSFPDGRDSNGNLITTGAVNRLDVLRNDNLGPTGTVREFGLVTAPSLGNVVIDNNGTPTNLNDDFLSYRANSNANGFERFTYVIVTDDNIRSTAEVTMALGSANANAEVALDFALVSGDGSNTPISSVAVGQRFGVQIIGEDLRNFSTIVFAGFLDVLYDAGIIQPADTNQADDFDFDVAINPRYTGVAGAGTAARQGIIDEFGAAFATFPTSAAGIPNPGPIATIFFNAVAPGIAKVVGSPADTFPAHDTLLLDEDDPVEVSRIRYDSLQIIVGGGGGDALQNINLPQDVNNDGTVSTIDALLIINTMNRESAEGESITSSQYYTDVNGDDKTSALDALQVINYLTRMQDDQLLNAEQVAQPLASKATDLSSSADAVFGGLEQDDVAKIVATDLPASAASSSVSVSTANDDADDDQDDVLSLLADDVSGLWG